MCRRISEGIKYFSLRVYFLGFLLSFFFQAAFAGQPRPRVEFIVKIWGNAGHNAFTDLSRYKGYWYCVFREANSHKPTTGNGLIRIIRSQDTSGWESVLTISDANYDLRDP